MIVDMPSGAAQSGNALAASTGGVLPPNSGALFPTVGMAVSARGVTDLGRGTKLGTHGSATKVTIATGRTKIRKE